MGSPSCMRSVVVRPMTTSKLAAKFGCRALPKKPTVAELVQDIPSLLRKPKLYYCIHMWPLMVSIQCQPNPVYNLSLGPVLLFCPPVTLSLPDLLTKNVFTFLLSHAFFVLRAFHSSRFVRPRLPSCQE
jgi:hypothetical protein